MTTFQTLCGHPVLLNGHGPTSGLCRKCYQRAAELVRRGKVTWAELESMGRALPLEKRERGVR